MKNQLFFCLAENIAALPISFTYNGTCYQGLGGLTVISTEKTDDELRPSYTVSLRLDSEVIIEVLLTGYTNFGACEWTVWFHNRGDKDSGVLSDVRCAEIDFHGDAPCLKGILGDYINQYRPYEQDLTKEDVSFRSDTGRPTHIWFPYFNLEHGDGGTMMTLGWGGTWEASFRYADGTTHFSGETTLDMCTYLHPGESVRTALVLLLPYDRRDEDYAFNLWRRFYIAHILPKADASGKDLTPFSTCFLAWDTGLPNSDGSISENYTTWRPSLERVLAEGIRPDFRWVDAGWYADPAGNTVPSDWAGTIGSWELDPVKWPEDTLRRSTDFAREHGMKTLLWFESERVTHVEDLEKNFGYRPEWALQVEDVLTNNIGNEDCLRWTVDRITRTLERTGCDMYREDNNRNPAPSWKQGDLSEGENRWGITENKAVVGHYRMWDAILDYCRANGKCTFVDCCASGGGRNDIESLRRGVPLLRSDADRESVSRRLAMTTSFDKWVPFCGAYTREKKYHLDRNGVMDTYVWRASYLPILNIDGPFTQDPDFDFDVLRFGMQEWDRVKPYLLKDFHIHTPYHPTTERASWTAYSYFDPQKEEGVLLAFRMEECDCAELTVKLEYVLSEDVYLLTDADSDTVLEISGAELQRGFTLSASTPRTARLWYIQKKK